MNRSEILENIRSCVAEETEQPGVVLDETTLASEVEGWDSLAHVRIVLGVSQLCGVDIDISDTYEANNMGELIDLIETRQLSQRVGA